MSVRKNYSHVGYPPVEKNEFFGAGGLSGR
nr:MAG TPA: hypothetical protein [Caudoviricetes sp.]